MRQIISFDICWARIVARHEAALTRGGDDHFVAREEMEGSFLHDDQDALIQHLQEQGIPVAVVNNETDGVEHLRRQVEELLVQIA